MTTEQGLEESTAELQHEPQGLDEIEASIAALEKAMLRPPARDRDAIHELGCSIVARAVMKDK
jgi:hypothetical protein